MEVDIWIPSRKLCFEFQDTYHFVNTCLRVSYLTIVRSKQEELRSQASTLVFVPCWWDGEADSLISTIQFQRPDIFPYGTNKTSPIPLNIPFAYFAPKGIEDLGELMLASFPHSHEFQENLESNLWWMGEKYDGIRACWNPVKKKMYTRNGLVVLRDSKFEQLLNKFIDAEIWFGKGTFPDAQRVLSASSIEDSEFRLITFDDANSEDPFEDRFQSVLEIAEDHPFLGGAEGLILQKRSSPYERGRSSELIKLKAVRGDQEALVVGLEEANVSLQLPDGIIFSAPLPPSIQPIPKVGNVVTFAYQNYARHQIPVHPQIQRVRFDISWKDVVSDFIQQCTSNPPELNEVTKRASGQAMKPKGYWISDNGRNLRLLLENFARQKNFEPLVADNWYNVQRSELLEVDISLERHNGSLVRALKDSFPELCLDDSKFNFVPKKHWSNEINRREVFDNFAKENGFDPLAAESWYFVSPTALREAKGVGSMLIYYQGSIPKALLHLYPNIGLDIRKFNTAPRVLHWSDPDNHRIFFDSIAAQSNFDPLVPENWYLVSSYRISAKGGNVLLNHYKGSLAHALRNVYPHIGLDLAKFYK